MSDKKTFEVQLGPESDKKAGVPLKEIQDALKKIPVDVAWEHDPEAVAKKLANQLKMKDDAAKKTAEGMILAAMSEKITLSSLVNALEKNQCKFMQLENGILKFYKAKPFEEKNAITEKEMEDAVLEVEAEGALKLFKEYFPGAKKDEIRVSKKTTVEKKAVIPLLGFGEALFYDVDGKRQRWNYDTTGLKKIPVRVVSPLVIQAPNADGIISEYVQIRAKFMGLYGEKDVLGWVEHGSFQKGEKGLETSKEPEADKKESKKKEAEKAFQEVKDEREDAELIKKHYDRDSGRINFKNADGSLDKKAQTAITLKKLFPNAKKDDEIRIKHADKTSRIAIFDEEKSDFVYKDGPDKGRHVPILDEDIVLQQWEKKEKIEGPSGRAWVKRQIVEETDTYESLVGEASKYPDIKNAFEKSTLTKAERIDTYAKLLKKFQKGNTVFFVIPKPEEIGVTVKKDGLDEKLTGKTEKYRKEFGEYMKKSGDEIIKKADEYTIKQFLLRPEIAGLVYSPEAWKKYWNEAGTKGISGLDKLISVLKEPIFVEAGLTEENARNKILELLRVKKVDPFLRHRELLQDRVDFKDILEVFGLYQTSDGKKGNFSDFQKEFEQNKKAMEKKGTSWMVIGEKFKKDAPELKIIEIMAEKKKEAKAKGYRNPFDVRLFKSEEERKTAIEQYRKARELFDDVAERQIYLNHIAFSGGRLLEALRHLGTSEFTPDTTPEKWSPDTKYSIESLQDVFADSTKTKVAWEDVLAEEGFDRKDLSEFGRYFDQDAPVLHLRERLHSYQNEKGELDGTERILASKTVEEYNRLMEKGLERLPVFKGKQAIALYQKYAGKTGVEDPYILFQSAFDRLKISNLDDLKIQKEASGADKELANFRKDLIKMGFYFDERDRETAIALEGKESAAEIAYSNSPLVYLIQKKLVAAGYPTDKERLKNKAETKILGWMAFKLDVLKGDFSAGIGTGMDILDLGDGVKLLLGFGVDPGSKSVMLMVGIRYAAKVGDGGTLGVTVGPSITLPGLMPGVGTGLDFTYPLTDTLDIGFFAGGGVSPISKFLAGGIGIRGNLDRAIKKAANEMLSSDKKMHAVFEAIDRTSDPDARYLNIITNPVLNQYFGHILNNPYLKPESKQMRILELYNAMRAELHNIATEKTETPGFDVPILNPIAKLLGGKARVTGMDLIGTIINGKPYGGIGARIEIGRTVLVYPVASRVSKEASRLSDKEIQEAFRIKLQKDYPGKIIEVKPLSLGSSGDVMFDENGNQCVRQSKETIDLTAFKDSPALEQYNEKLKPLNMKFELDEKTGLFELKIYAIGNLKLMIDPGMERKGLILRNETDSKGNLVQKVFLAAGKNPEFFISRELFRTPFPEKDSPLNTIICISDRPERSAGPSHQVPGGLSFTPDRTRAEIEGELAEKGAWLYKKAGMQWKLMFIEGTKTSNVVYFEAYQKSKKSFETFKEKEGQSFKSELFEAHKKRLKGLRFIKEDIGETIDDKLIEGFAKGFLGRNQILYRKLTTVAEKDTSEMVVERTKEFVKILQKDAVQEPPKGIGRKLNYLEVNAVMSRLMDLSFIELEESGASVEAKRAKFEINLRYAKKAALIPYFRKKIAELAARGKGIDTKNTPEKLADYVVAQLLKNVSDEDLKKPPNERGEKFPGEYIFDSTAASMHIEGMRGVPYYIQKNFSVLGLQERVLTKGKGIERDLAILILETESPLETETDKKFIESPLAQKVIAMPGLWLVLGDDLATEAVDCAKKALEGTKLTGFKGWDEFKKIVNGIRDTQLVGGNFYTYKNKYNNTYEFHIDTKTATGAHANCGNPAFGAKESLAIVAKPEKDEKFLIAVGNEKTATVSPKTMAKTYGIGVAGVFTATSEGKAAPAPEKLGRSRIPPGKEAPSTTFSADEGGVSENVGKGAPVDTSGGTSGGSRTGLPED